MSRKLSVIITTFNEEENIARCLESVADIADDILIVDSFSTDKTVEIAQRYPVRIEQRKYQGPADQKNWAIPQAQHECILLLDADETATADLRVEIQSLLDSTSGPEHEAYWIGRDNFFMGQAIRFSGWQGDQVVRFFHRDKARYDSVQVHEEILTQNLSVGKLKGRLEHYTFRNLEHYLDKTRRYARWSAQDHSAKTPKVGYYHLLVKPLFRFWKHFIVQQGFRDGKVGFIVSVIMAWGVFLRYAYLREERAKAESPPA